MAPEAEILAELCRRFMLAVEASGDSKGTFARNAGLSPQQLSNIANKRNAPAHAAIWRVIRVYGFTADWFYQGSAVGFRDPELARRLLAIEARLRHGGSVG